MPETSALAREGSIGAPLYIQHIATALPPHALTQEAAADLLTQGCRTERAARLLRRVLKLTDIEQRHLAVLALQADTGVPEAALYQPASTQPNGPGMGARTAAFEKLAPPLVRSALAALPQAALSDVDTLVTCSCTHASSPGLEYPVLATGALRADVQRWNLGFMGCSAGLAALRMVWQQRAAAPRALLLACELSSLHFQYAEALDQMTANLLFADGCAAALVGPGPGIAQIIGAQCVTLPAAADEMRWFADDCGLRLHLSQALPTTLAQHLPSAVEKLLQPHGLATSDVRHWVVHPGGPQILDQVEASLSLPALTLDGSRAVLRRCGNMSSPTIFFILQQLLREHPAPGHCVALAFGPGLTIELVLLRLCGAQAD